ncbi:hypothetical protein ATY77_16695 [Rhizobium sp. R634]|nr:hypothetical protein ATY77_16695 [Rhizobium sp. R634]
MPQPTQQLTIGKRIATLRSSAFKPLYLYLAFVAAGWGLIYVFDPPSLVYNVMVMCCTQFGLMTFGMVRAGMKRQKRAAR